MTLGAGDSGINLKPSDSGLNLDEEPLDLGGSAVESLELPEDDDVIALEEEPADPEEATQLKADDQFMLSASDALMEDESDSGSQVIALEDSEAFDENAATMLKAGEQPGLLSDDAFAAAATAAPMDPLAAATLSPGMAPAGAPDVHAAGGIALFHLECASLFAIVILLAFTGMFMTDVMLNMWSWNGERLGLHRPDEHRHQYVWLRRIILPICRMGSLASSYMDSKGVESMPRKSAIVVLFALSIASGCCPMRVSQIQSEKQELLATLKLQKKSRKPSGKKPLRSNSGWINRKKEIVRLTGQSTWDEGTGPHRRKAPTSAPSPFRKGPGR